MTAAKEMTEFNKGQRRTVEAGGQQGDLTDFQRNMTILKKLKDMILFNIR